MSNRPTYEELEQRVQKLENEVSEWKLPEKQAWETCLREIFNAFNDGIFIHDKETGAILDVNNRVCEIRRQSREEILNATVGELSSGEPPYTQTDAVEWMRLAVEEGPQFFEWLTKYKDGSFVWAEVNLISASLPGRDCVIAITREITKLKQAEDELRKHHDQLEKKIKERTSELKNEITKRKRTEKALRESEKRYRNSAKDLDKKLREAEYRQLWNIFSQSVVPTLFLSKEGKIVEYNAAMVELTGYAHEEVPDLNSWMPKIYPDEQYRNQVIEISTKSWKREQDVKGNIFTITRKNGEIRHIVFTVYDILHGEESTDIQVVQGEDTTERILAEDALQKVHDELESKVESRTAELNKTNMKLKNEISDRISKEKSFQEAERLSRMLMDSLPYPAMLINKNRTVLARNRIAGEFGVDIGSKCWKTFGQGLYLSDANKKLIENGKEPLNPMCHFCLADKAIDGKCLVNDSNVETAGIFDTYWVHVENDTCLHYAVDVTERKQMQKQLIRSERLAATGQLAASIAHEINSPLQAVTVMLSSMKKEHEQNKELSSNIDLLTGAFESIRDTVNNLSDLNRPGQAEIKSININDTIEKTTALFRNNLKKNRIKVNLELSSRVSRINASSQQMSQVFLNLLNNAIEAMSRNIQGKRTSATDREINIKTNLRKENIIIRFSDSGPGFFKDDLDEVFDPFYTRKKVMGLGVGLSICHDIVKDHGGSITATNSSEGGAVFTIKLPADQTK